jgi:hypothetical protein
VSALMRIPGGEGFISDHPRSVQSVSMGQEPSVNCWRALTPNAFTALDESEMIIRFLAA